MKGKSTWLSVTFWAIATIACLNQSLPSARAAQVWGANSHPTRTTASHNKRVIGYITQWDAWKDSSAGLPTQGYLNHLNIDYSQYTHLNYSFFGVADDGSLHSGDYRNQNIWEAGQVQSPAPMLDGDVYSSWDYWLLYGDLSLQWDFSNPATAAAGFASFNSGWSNSITGLSGPMPVPLPNTNGAPGLLALAHANGVKVMASVGGWSMCKHYPATAADPTMSARFVANCKQLMAIGFDGIDFDWEYPGPYAGMNFTGSTNDYADFLSLIQQVRTAIGPNKQISVCLSATPAKLSGFDWPSMVAVVDSLNLMTYDFQGGWSTIAGHNAPLYSYPSEEGGPQACSLCVADLISRGVPASKIAMGVPFYGRGVVCSNTAVLNGSTAQSSQFVQPDGPIVTCADYVNWPVAVWAGVPNYSYLRSYIGTWTRHWDTNAEVPYLTSGNYFLSYDDSHSVGLKAQYVSQQALGGVIIWNAFGDIIPGPISNSGDKLPFSPTNRAPLVNVVNSVLAGDPVPPDGTEGPVAPNTPPSLTVADASVVEGTSGTTNLTFNLTLSYAATGTVSVAYYTANGTAFALTNYLATNGTVTFTAGQTTGSVLVPVVGGTNVGPNLTFNLYLTNIVGASLSRTQAVGTIINNNSSSGGTTNIVSGWPTNLFAPYVDFTAWPPYDIIGAATNTGLRYATLAFIVADPSQDATNASPTNIPAWGGYTEYSAASGYRLSDIATFRSYGGDVIVSFGGSAGTELAAYITDTNRLQMAYQYVINTYSATRIDFDIEGAWVADTASINRRSVVLAGLQAAATAAGRALQISLTLPVLPSGLDNNGLYVLQSAVSNHVNLTCVNVMAMDYGDNAAPSPAGKMGTYAIMAATNLFNQLKSVYQAANISKTDAQLWQMVGVTPMLGVNDATDEIFDQPAATQLVAYAESKDFGLLAFWSMNRDQPGDSGVTQTAYQFADIFLGYGGNTAPAPSVSATSAGVVMPTNGYASLVFPVNLSAASTGTVSVAYFTSDGTAVSPGDYLATNGMVTFTAGQTVRSVSVIVPGHTNVGANKTFYLNLTNAVGANLFATQVAGTITNNNTSGGGGNGGGGGSVSGSGECALTSQWLVTYDGSAFRAILTLANPNSTNITINTFAFNAPYTGVDWIAADAGLSDWVAPTHSGNLFTVSSGWNPAAVIPAGGSLQLTFQAEPGGSPPGPTNLVVNGVSVGNCGGWPLYFTKIARQGQNVVLTWTTPAGHTNHLMMASSLNPTNWVDISGPIPISGTGSVSTNWTDTAGASGPTARFYKVVMP